MIGALQIYLIVVALVFLALLLAFLFYNASFKNVVYIARQTGKDTDNVIWSKDKFKVVNKNGYYIIRFKSRQVRNPDFEGKFYSVFIKPSKLKTAMRYTKEEWETNDMSKKIQRGLFLYETNEGQLYPMRINIDNNNAEFLVLGQDKRRWLADEIRDINELTRNRTKDIILLVAAIVAIAALAVIFIFGFIYLNEQGTKSISANQIACTTYIDKLINLTETAKEQGRTGFLENAKNTVVGG